jgi:hypothetical protein
VFKFTFLNGSNIGVQYTEGLLSEAEDKKCEAVHTAVLLLVRGCYKNNLYEDQGNGEETKRGSLMIRRRNKIKHTKESIKVEKGEKSKKRKLICQKRKLHKV